MGLLWVGLPTPAVHTGHIKRFSDKEFGTVALVSVSALRILLVVLGLLNVLIGINVGFGGITTLGLHGEARFIEVVDWPAFLVRDSHIRYFGGLYLGIGLFLMLAVTNLRRYQSALNLVFVLMFVGGLTRFTMLRPDVTFAPGMLPSLVVELLIMPIFVVWVAHSVVRQQTHSRSGAIASGATSSA